jgi:uncharacterized membrane protein YcaP (DUF421 family)
LDIVVRAVVVYVLLWLVIRALGKRELSEFTAFELVLLFVVGDLVQQSVTQNDTSITAAILAVSTIAVLIVSQSLVAFRWPRARKVLEGLPAVLVRDGSLVNEALKLERVSQDEPLSKREATASVISVGYALPSWKPTGRFISVFRCGELR